MHRMYNHSINLTSAILTTTSLSHLKLLIFKIESDINVGFYINPSSEWSLHLCNIRDPNNAMEGLRRIVLCCLFLVLLSLLCSEARSPGPFSKSDQPLFMKSAREVLKEGIRRQEIIGKLDISDRVSPGGPDPHHN